MENIFLQATRQRLRFDKENTGVNTITTEDLWQLPLAKLDTIAIAINKKIKETSEESFVKAKSTSNTELELKLEILKFIINTKQEEQKAKQDDLAKQQKIAQLKDLLADKHQEKLKGLSAEEIEAELAKLQG